MPYQSQYNEFIFERYEFNLKTGIAEFYYSFDQTRQFVEKVQFDGKFVEVSNQEVLENALKLAFYVIGTSYYKAFPTKKVIFKVAQPDEYQATFLQEVYTNGLSQFIFENNLTLDDIAVFSGEGDHQTATEYNAEGTLALQSGGKDSLLMTSLLQERNTNYTAMYVSSSDHYPKVLDKLQSDVRVIKRILDIDALKDAAADGGLEGHVPITYIVESFALIDAILHGEDKILVSIGAEGGEAHEHVGNLAVNHQWSKTWEAEQLLAEYVEKYISENLKIGSPLRGYSELKIAELFVEKCWKEFGHSFSSCNLANYQQGEDNTELRWCGECPKCANSYLLFAPFVEPKELRSLFGGQDLFVKPILTVTFKGLLGIEGVMKPFECVGEVGELRLAYHMAQQRSEGEHELPFNVPASEFDYEKINPNQDWSSQLITTV
jgi:7-cyano-7-deazaguanine synthase in queuosine biosynthesis